MTSALLIPPLGCCATAIVRRGNFGDHVDTRCRDASILPCAESEIETRAAPWARGTNECVPLKMRLCATGNDTKTNGHLGSYVDRGRYGFSCSKARFRGRDALVVASAGRSRGNADTQATSTDMPVRRLSSPACQRLTRAKGDSPVPLDGSPVLRAIYSSRAAQEYACQWFGIRTGIWLRKPAATWQTGGSRRKGSALWTVGRTAASKCPLTSWIPVYEVLVASTVIRHRRNDHRCGAVPSEWWFGRPGDDHNAYYNCRLAWWLAPGIRGMCALQWRNVGIERSKDGQHTRKESHRTHTAGKG